MKSLTFKIKTISKVIFKNEKPNIRLTLKKLLGSKKVNSINLSWMIKYCEETYEVGYSSIIVWFCSFFLMAYQPLRVI